MTIYSFIRHYFYGEQNLIQNLHPLRDVPGEIISHIYSFVEEDASIPLLSQAFNEAQNIQYGRRFKKLTQIDHCLKEHIQRVRETKDLTLYSALKETALAMQCNEQDYKWVELISNSSKQLIAIRQVIENQTLLIFFEKTHKMYDKYLSVNGSCPASTCYLSLKFAGNLIDKASLIREWLKKKKNFLEGIVSLTMKNQNLVYLPKEISLLSNLKIINLYNNEIRALPKEIDALFKLQYLFTNSQNLYIESETDSFKDKNIIYKFDLNNSADDLFIECNTTREHIEEILEEMSSEEELSIEELKQMCKNFIYKKISLFHIN